MNFRVLADERSVNELRRDSVGGHGIFVVHKMSVDTIRVWYEKD